MELGYFRRIQEFGALIKFYCSISCFLDLQQSTEA